MQAAMQKDFSWGASAREYVKLYGELAGRKPPDRPTDRPKQTAKKKSIA
jgi:hypothetical protein